MQDQSNKPHWVARPVVESDLPQVSQLRQESLESARGSVRRSGLPSYYQWKIFDNPIQPGIFHVAVDGQKVVGTTTMTPKRIRIKNDAVLSAEIGDTFTHVDYQRQGIFSALVKMTVKKGLEQDIRFIYGTPNHNSLPGYEKKLNFAQIPSSRVIHLVRPLNIPSLISSRTRWPRLSRFIGAPTSLAYESFFSLRNPTRRYRKNFTIQTLNEFPNDLEALWEKASAKYDWILERKASYLNYRFVKNPDTYTICVARHHSEIAGYIVLKKGTWNGLKVGFIADFLVDEGLPGSFAVLLDHSLAWLRDEAMDMVSTWVVHDSFYDRFLRRFGFLKYKRIPVITFKNDLGERSLQREDRWHFTMADSDNI